MTQLRNAYLEISFAAATLAEHHEFRLNHEESPTVAALHRYLQFPAAKLVSVSQTYSLCDIPMFHRAVRACFPDWKLVEQCGGHYRNSYYVPRYRRFKTSPGSSRQYLVEGGNCYRLPDGSHRVMLHELVEDISTQFSVLFFASKQDWTKLRGSVKQIRDWIRRHKHYLQGQAIRADGTLLPAQRSVTWNDVILESTVREELLRHTFEFFAHRRLFRKNRIPQRRGILLYGPPGNGKTMIGKILAAQGESTFIYTTAGDIEKPNDMRECFRLARRLRPTVLFFEDLDFFASRRDGNLRDTTLGEMLGQMDGLEKNDGLFVIGTTNDLEAIEPALKDRPSRFDVVLQVAAPGENRRHEILAHYLGGRLAAESLVAHAAHHAAGFSCAQLKELSIQTLQQAILGGRVDAEGLAHPIRDDLEAALTRMGGKAKKPLGFQVATNGAARINGVGH